LSASGFGQAGVADFAGFRKIGRRNRNRNVSEELCMTSDRIIIERVVSAMFDQNSYLVWKHGEPQAVAIDPGFEVESLIRLIRSNGLTLAEIWITHGHADHIMGLDKLHREFPEARIVIGAAEEEMLRDPEKNLSAPMGFPVVAPQRPGARMLKK